MAARLRPYFLLFLGLVAVYNANLRPIDSSDSLPGSLIPFAVLLDHSVVLDRFVPWLRGNVWYTPEIIVQAHGHFFSSYPIAGPLLLSPVYLPMAFVARHWDPGSMIIFARIAEKFVASATAAFSAALMLLLLKRIVSLPWAWILTVVYALATETWSIASQAMWQHGPALIAIIGCFYCLARWTAEPSHERWLWGCGTCAAASFLIRPTCVVLLAALVTALWLGKATVRQQIQMLAIPLAGGMLLVAYNLYVFQRPSGGYAVGLLTGSMLAGMAGVFLSPGRGLLIYTPVAVFALFAFVRGAGEARRQHRALFVAAWMFIVLYAIGISRSVSWWGGFCWGPRMLSEAVPPLIVLMALGMKAIDRPGFRQAFAALACYSLLTQAAGAFFYPKGHWDSTPQPVDSSSGRLWNWGDNPITRTVRAGPYWEPYAIVGAALTGGISGAQKRLHELNVNPFEQAKPAAGRGGQVQSRHLQ